LGAEELFGGAGEASFTGYGEEDFQLGQIHGIGLGSRFSPVSAQGHYHRGHGGCTGFTGASVGCTLAFFCTFGERSEVLHHY
jgi:hypothetical protein